MVLKKIEITGFKSFAQKSVLDFCLDKKNAKVTSVVGPNGSGKSNVADAIRWVLGEQSYKLLRSKKSEDVIFSGSEKRQRGSLSEVALFLENENNRLPIEFSEVCISRRLYRSGENEYRINGSKVRLLDVQELLAKCGFGQATYTVIGQGMVDQMLFYGPKERKVLFDEAAGVKQYELKREQSIRKLEATDQNLIRVKDIFNELSPRLRHLKKQVERAEEREESESELSNLLNKFYSYKWNKLNLVLTENEGKREEIDKKKGDEEKQLEELNKIFEGNERKSFEASDEFRKKIRLLSEERDILKEQLIVISGRLRIEQEKEKFEGGEHFETEKNEKNKAIEEILNKISLKEKELSDSKTELADLIKKMSEIQTGLLEAQSLLRSSEDGEENLLKLKKEYSDLSKWQDDLISVLEKSKSMSDIDGARDKAIEIKKMIDSFWEKIRKLNKKDTGNEAFLKVERFSKEKDDLFSRVSEIKVSLSATETTILNLKNQKTDLENQIKKIITNIEDFKSSDDNWEKIAEMKAELDNLTKKVVEKESEIENIRAKIKQEEDSSREKEKEILETRAKARAKQTLIDDLNYSLRDIAIEIAKIETKKEDLAEEISRDIEGGVDAIEKIKETDIDEERALQKIYKLRQRLAQIGGIDEDATEEYKETEERYTYLEEQLTDLEKAKEDLRKIIRELDDKIGLQFDKAFSKISKEFKKFFEMLFDGGRADLQLNKSTDEDGGEELGIEITACPPGKKVKSLNVLSGGERTLTSLALLFAILSVNPSPFCVLDEVDAALDENNTRRFLKILSELAVKTQFILITHNRDTMKIADILYGVTMDAEHVSKLLSLKLKEAEAVGN